MASTLTIWRRGAQAIRRRILYGDDAQPPATNRATALERVRFGGDRKPVWLEQDADEQTRRIREGEH